MNTDDLIKKLHAMSDDQSRFVFDLSGLVQFAQHQWTLGYITAVVKEAELELTDDLPVPMKGNPPEEITKWIKETIEDINEMRSRKGRLIIRNLPTPAA